MKLTAESQRTQRGRRDFGFLCALCDSAVKNLTAPDDFAEADKMRKYKKNSKHKILNARNALCLLICMLCASISAQAATLEPKTGARPLGMAAFAAVADDINAINWNPAGLSLLQKQEAMAIYASVYGDMGQSYLAYAYPTGKYGTDRKSTRLNSSHIPLSRMPSSA